MEGGTKMPAKTLIGYVGGKGNMVAKIVLLIESIPHTTYVEPFGGGMAVLLNKRPSRVEVYNDIDSNLVNLFRVIRDKEKFEEFKRLVSLTPYSRTEFYYCKETLNEGSDIERAWKFFIIHRQSMAGIGATWGMNVKASWRKMAGNVSSYLSCIEKLDWFHQRIMRVQIEHNDFRKIFETYDTPETLFYCDPPYLNAKTEFYKYSMTEQDHRELIEILLNLRGKALLSGYENEIYKVLENRGWRVLKWKTVSHAPVRSKTSGLQGEGSCLKKVPRIECLWVSPNCEINYNLFQFKEIKHE